MFTPGSQACAYKTASGLGKWPNRDPLGEVGFELAARGLTNPDKESLKENQRIALNELRLRVKNRALIMLIDKKLLQIETSKNSGRNFYHFPAEESEGPNLYGYIGNNPLNRIDPLGLYWHYLPGGGGYIDPDDYRNFYCPISGKACRAACWAAAAAGASLTCPESGPGAALCAAAWAAAASLCSDRCPP